MENKSNKGVKVVIVILLILLVGAAMFIVGQYTLSKGSISLFKSETTSEEKSDDNEIDTETTTDDTTEEVTEEEDNTEILKKITTVYENAFDNINTIIEGSDTSTINETLAANYFTDKAISYIENEVANIRLTSFPLGTIFNSTDQGKRPLTIVTKTDDVVIATGQLLNNESLDNDSYPLYIIFKKVNDTYKIDMFE